MLNPSPEPVFIPGIFSFGGGGISPKKLTIPLPKRLPNCVLRFGRDSELQIYHGNFLLMDNKHRKLFVVKQLKGANLCLDGPKYVWQPAS